MEKKITQDNKSRTGWTENNEDNKIKDIDNADKKKLSGQFFCSDNFLSGQKGIYHQVEIRQKY